MQNSPAIFGKTALRRFLTEMILEIDPTLSISEYTIEYFVQIYNIFIFDKTAFELWKVRNDHQSF